MLGVKLISFRFLIKNRCLMENDMECFKVKNAT